MKIFGRTTLLTAISVAVASVIPAPALAVPVVPNFQQGSMTSHTETNSTVTETINSIDYRTGWEYSVTGVGISNNGTALNPNVNTSTVNVTPTAGSTDKQLGRGKNGLNGQILYILLRHHPICFEIFELRAADY